MKVIKDFCQTDLVIVGAGFFGATIAERVATQIGKKVTIIEKRNHVAGNAFDYLDSKTKIEVHKYGTHIFHTSNDKVIEYAKKYTQFNDYKHKVFSISKGKVYSLPFNLLTLAQIQGQYVSPQEAIKVFNLEPNTKIQVNENLREKAIRLVGLDIYETLIEGYTQKQWQTNPSLLPGDIISRLPIRETFNSNYFEDKFQGIPSLGYTKWIESMLSNDKIEILLETDFFDIKSQISCPVVYCGPIDKYFNWIFGHLNWRTLDFEFETIEKGNFQGTAVMNYADIDIPYTRIHEFKHLHPEKDYLEPNTIISREFSRRAKMQDEPYYPVRAPEDLVALRKYKKMAEDEKRQKKVYFGGRLGSYLYLDMHMAIASALNMFENEIRHIL
jgi:UDP-galactopyranose mutase